MHLHERSHEGEPDAEPFMRATLVRSHLREHVKDVLERRWRNSHAVVLDRDDGLTAPALEREHDAATPVSVLGAIREQVREHLGQAVRIALDEQIIDAQIGDEFVSARFEERMRRLGGAREDIGEQNPQSP